MSSINYMHRCFELAQKAKGRARPNPMVGAVLVHNDRVIGEGWHHFYGGDHAEVNCLKAVSEEDKRLIPESVMYVNLEPCAHHGITGPCANRLVHEKVKKVVIAHIDTNEKVSGKGISILKEGGVEVETGICEQEAAWLNRRFFCFHTQNRPYIVLKWAQTRDGYLAGLTRSRLQITDRQSRQLVHKWRTEETAIMVGSTTALRDNPQLTARHWEGQHPLRIVLDRNLQLPQTHHVFDNTAATWVINEHHDILSGNINSIRLPFDDILLQRIMARLYDAKIISIIIEGGATLLNSFISQGLWDEARVFTGNMTIKEGIPAPPLQNEIPAFATSVGIDELNVFINKSSPYQYSPGMDL